MTTSYYKTGAEEIESGEDTQETSRERKRRRMGKREGREQKEGRKAEDLGGGHIFDRTRYTVIKRQLIIA